MAKLYKKNEPPRKPHKPPGGGVNFRGEGGGVKFRVKECIIARVYHSWQVYHPEEAVSYHSLEAS